MSKTESSGPAAIFRGIRILEDANVGHCPWVTKFMPGKALTESVDMTREVGHLWHFSDCKLMQDARVRYTPKDA